MQCKWQVEIDPYCRRVLAKHWPAVRQCSDVRTFPPEPEDGVDWGVDVVCGGFPCQDISNAGLKAGLDGARSGLWWEMYRIIRYLRPSYVVVENVAALLNRGHDRILSDMARIGFDGEWEVLSACSFGAPHSRERMFYVFYPHGSQLRASRSTQGQVAPAIMSVGRTGSPRQLANWWATQSEPCSVVYGLSRIVDRLRPYGNAVVPQIAEYIGRRIVEAANVDCSQETESHA